MKYHVICLAQRLAIITHLADPPVQHLADHDTSSVVAVLGTGAACIPCLVSTAGLPEVEIVDSLRQL